MIFSVFNFFDNMKLKYVVIFISLSILFHFNKTYGAIQNPGNQQVNEDETLIVKITATSGVRIFIRNKPPGSIWNEVNRTLTFTPDFIQGGQSWSVILEAPEINSTVQFTITVNDTIKPPAPILVSTEDLWQAKLYRYKIKTDNYLDSPGYAGRELEANIVVPNSASSTVKFPMLVKLHAYTPVATAPTVGNGALFGVATVDPGNTWWTGYSDTLPLQQGQIVTGGTVKNYSQRRVMHLLHYAISTFPGVDLDNINVEGTSMGSVGGMMMASKFSRHFNIIQGEVGSVSLSRLNVGQIKDQADRFFGARNLNLLDERGKNAWNAFDTNIVAETDFNFRNLFFYQEYGQNDTLVPFKRVAERSDLNNKTFSETLRDEGIGHLIAWDQRNHSSGEDSIYKYDWWYPLTTMSLDLNNYLDQLRRNRPFPAFSNSSADSTIEIYDPLGNLVRAGTLRGVINRYFRWDGKLTKEDRDHVSIPIRILTTQEGSPSTDPNYPVLGNEYFGSIPIVTDITVRRLNQFQLLPNEVVNWYYGAQSGTANANSDGSVTIRKVSVYNTYQNLEIKRLSNSPLIVSISSPIEGSKISGVIPVKFSYSDNIAVTTIELFIDGQLYSKSTSSPFTIMLDSSKLSNSNHTLIAHASDSTGNKSVSSPISINVNNLILDTIPPLVEIKSPANNSSVTGALSINVNASDLNGVSFVELYIDGNYHSKNTATPYTFTLDTSTLNNGSHTLVAQAVDSSGNRGFSSGVNIIVNNENTVIDTEPPQIVITSPTQNSLVSGEINLSVEATDNVGVVLVEYYIDGVFYAKSTEAPFTISLNTSTLSATNHSLSAKAYDDKLNSTTSPDITFKVQNNIEEPIDNEPPLIVYFNLSDGMLINRKQLISVSARDNKSVSKIEIYINDILQYSILNTQEANYNWNGKKIRGNYYDVRVKVTDSSGNSVNRGARVLFNN